LTALLKKHRCKRAVSPIASILVVVVVVVTPVSSALQERPRLATERSKIPSRLSNDKGDAADTLYLIILNIVYLRELLFCQRLSSCRARARARDIITSLCTTERKTKWEIDEKEIVNAYEFKSRVT